MHESEDNKFIPMTSITSRSGEEVTNDVFYYTDQIVNISFIGFPKEGKWVLVDAGLPYAAEEIRAAAAERFGENSEPEAIILTHGHFDHVGGLVQLLENWDVPVYAHPLELPYLTGEKSYPEPDGTVEGGLLAKISPMYPNEPVNLGDAVQALPDDHTVPGMPEWKWLHTPGHAPGHVSFFRESDRLLLAGDAFITVKQDSFYKVLMQTPEINGPPVYLTTDWDAAWHSVRKLAELQPETVITGHGVAMDGEVLRDGLARLVKDFREIAVPDYGRFVDGREH
jgi:glyoxylase-like metal-dependent hydrolase (beta-lactamase superfamily II)